ncbi:MAG: LLM class F420-dependent oxidoreductase [Actinomycetota bacterium]|nr:LLM class F420-dependent oxidoreductase [Actinomycetota bacterium]
MRFGAFVPQGWRMDLVDIPVEEQWGAMVSVARTAEEAGFDSVWVYDHFHTVPRPSQQSTFECWATMAGLAAATRRVRLGQMVTCNSYRHPSYLAKASASIDVMSQGRLEFGIGAGWYEHEYLAYGYRFPKPSVRIGMMEEGVRIIKAMWTEDQASFEGRHYSVQGAINRPKPLQKPHPPVWIGGGGEQLTLRVVAEQADFSNFGAGNLEVFGHKSQVLERHCRQAGRDPAEIGRSSSFDCLIAASEDQVERALRALPPNFGDPERFRARALVGTPEQVVEQLRRWDEAGCAYAIVYFADALQGVGMRLFGEQVIPKLSADAVR